MSHRGLPKTRQIRERLRKEAAERQVEYDKLTLQQKLDRLPPAPQADRQRAKLTALLTKPKPVVDIIKFRDEGRASGDPLSLGSLSLDEPQSNEEVTIKKLRAKERRAKEKK